MERPIDDITLPIGGEPLTLDVTANFSDPEGESLTYTAASDNDAVAKMNIAGNIATITPVSVGETTATIMATDGSLAASQNVTITVSAGANRPPEAVGIMQPLKLILDESAVNVNLATGFNDPEDDKLSYSAESSDTDTVAVDVFGTVLEATPVNEGTATVTVTAADEFGSTAIQTIEVTVAVDPTVNHAPASVTQIDDVELNLGADGATIDVSSNFADPDGDILSFWAVSADVNVVSVDTSGASVTIAPVSMGSVTIIVSAYDPPGLSASQAITVVVNEVANRAPETVGTLEDLNLNVNDNPVALNIALSFRDPDGDSLRYDAASSDSNVAAAAMLGNVLVIAPIGVGTATLTITARDPGGLVSPSLTVTVTVEDAGSPAPTANQIELLPNFPNPFNPDTWIPFRLAVDAPVTVTVYDSKGSRVRTFDLGYMSAGSYESKSKAIYWDGKNDFGEQVSSGVYFYRLSTPHGSVIRKTSVRK